MMFDWENVKLIMNDPTGKREERFEAVALPNRVSLNASVSSIRNTLMTFTLL